MSAAAPQYASPVAVEPLTSLARVAQTALPPSSMPSLGFQFASAISQLGSYLHVRGDECVEHYYAAALTLAGLEPAGHDTRPYEALLLTFIRFDRRSPSLSILFPAAQFQIQRPNVIHFIQLLHDQAAFRAIYAAARQLDAYPTRAPSPRKIERIVFLARELSGRPLLNPLTELEQIYSSLSAVA